MILLQAHSLNRTGAFEAETCGLNMAEKDGQIQFTVGPEAPEMETGQWIMDDEEPGAGIIYRIRTIENNYSTETRTVTAEHIIKILKDTAIFGEVKPEDMGGSETAVPAETAIRYALSRQSDWVMPANDGFGYSVSAGYSFNGDSVYEAIETVCTTLENCWWSYDLSVYPFKIYIQPKETTATCEMRMGRNISTIKRTMDASRMYTRIYPIGKDNLHITGSYLSMNEGTYGTIMKVETDQTQETEADLRLWALGRLRRHCEPSVTISISGLELSEATGEPLDRLRIGRACRVPLPEYGTFILENITRMQWRDKKKEKETVTVTLANTVEDVASIIRQEMASTSATTGKASRSGAKKSEEDHAWFVDTKDKVAMVAEAVGGQDENGNTNWSRVSTLCVDGNGIESRVTHTEGDMVDAQSRITQTEDSISLALYTTEGNFTLRTYAKKENFPATGDANTIYLDNSTGTYYGWYNGEYTKASITRDENDNIISAHFIKAAEIAMSINESGQSEAKIDADKVYIGRIGATDFQWLDDFAGDAKNRTGVFANYIYATKLTANEFNALFADIMSVNSGNVMIDDELDASVVQADTLKVLVGDDNYSNVMLYDAIVNSQDGTVTFYYTNGTTATFRKATALSGAWSGSTLTVTGTPAQTPALDYDIGFGNVTADMHLGVSLGTPAATATTKMLSIPVSVNELKDPESGEQPITERYTTDIVANCTPAYNQGWAAAYDKVAEPGENTSTGTFSVGVPTSTVDAEAGSFDFTLIKGTVPGHTGHAKVIFGDVSSEDAVTVAQIDIGNWYDAGWRAAYGKVEEPGENTNSGTFAVKVPPSTVDGNAESLNFTLQPGSVPGHTGYAKVLLGDVSSEDVVTVAQVDIGNWYDSGWGAAYGKITLPNEVVYADIGGLNATATFGTPKSSPNNTADTHSYTIQTDDNNSVLLVHNQPATAGKAYVAKFTHNKYNAGWGAARVTLPHTEKTNSNQLDIPYATATVGTKDTEPYTVHADGTYAWIEDENETIVARTTHNQYNTGFDAVGAPLVSLTEISANQAANIAGTASIANKLGDNTPRSTSISLSVEGGDGSKTFSNANGDWTHYCVEVKNGSTVVGRADCNGIYGLGVTAGNIAGQNSVKVIYNDSYTPSGASTAVKAVVPSTASTAVAYVPITLDTGSLTNGSRTVAAKAGSETAGSATITDYKDGYNAAARAPAAWIDYFGQSTTAGSATMAASTRQEDGSALLNGGTLWAGATLGLYYNLHDGGKHYKAKWLVPDTAADLRAAGGEYTASGTGDFTLNQYVTTLHVTAGGSHSIDIDTDWTSYTSKPSNATELFSARNGFENQKWYKFKVTCGDAEKWYAIYMKRA